MLAVPAPQFGIFKEKPYICRRFPCPLFGETLLS